MAWYGVSFNPFFSGNFCNLCLLFRNLLSTFWVSILSFLEIFATRKTIKEMISYYNHKVSILSFMEIFATFNIGLHWAIWKSFNPFFSGNFCNQRSPASVVFSKRKFQSFLFWKFLQPEKGYEMVEENATFQSFLFWKFLQQEKQYEQMVTIYGFNPFFSGNFCNMNGLIVDIIQYLRFNPFFSGNFCNEKKELEIMFIILFQSFLFWKFLQPKTS